MPRRRLHRAYAEHLDVLTGALLAWRHPEPHARHIPGAGVGLVVVVSVRGRAVRRRAGGVPRPRPCLGCL